MGVFSKPPKPKDPVVRVPKVPPEPLDPAAVQAGLEQKKKAMALAYSTIKTDPKGLTTPASTATKTVLGV